MSPSLRAELSEEVRTFNLGRCLLDGSDAQKAGHAWSDGVEANKPEHTRLCTSSEHKVAH